MIALTGGDLVLPDRIVNSGTLVVNGPRIESIETGPAVDSRELTAIDVTDCYVVPGFIDVHVHGVDGIDCLDPGEPVALLAARLPGYGVTAFCPTTVACSPVELVSVLAQVRRARVEPPDGSSRVLPAHLESNFINPEYKGAQPETCLRRPRPESAAQAEGDFSAADIRETIERARVDVGIVTLAPELPGALDLVTDFVSSGLIVSLGHSGADFDQAMAAIDAGASHATHLFNRMPPMTHRAPGLAGAVLSRQEVAAELICDGHHVHPAIGRMAIQAKGVDRMMAITDGTAGAGLPVGMHARLGGRTIRVSERAAVLEDGTLAGSTLTMDAAFRNCVTMLGLSIVEATHLCATTPARQLRLTGFGVIAEGAAADLVVLDRTLRVRRTFVGGVEVYRAGTAA